MKKLRLLFTEDCNNNCEKCSNKQYNLKELPVCESYKEYDEILITGGEPFLHPEKLSKLVSEIRRENNKKIYIYTSLADIEIIRFLLFVNIDGITLTLHNKEDIKKFINLSKKIRNVRILLKNKSLRLNVFQNLIKEFKSSIEKSLSSELISNPEEYKELYDEYKNWKTKYIKWIDNCPIPENEKFMKYEKINNK